MNTRQIKILDIISKKGRVEVADLAHLCEVSTVTIRKDLDLLESRELLKREHGYAMINNIDNINYRLAMNYADKHQLAIKALQFIQPNETVLIESGSSCTLLALEIAKRSENNTIITNSSFIARYLKDYPSTKVILLGGEYQSTSEAIVGPLVGILLNSFNVDKIFIGTDGLSIARGVTGNDLDRTQTVKLMIDNCNTVFVLSESIKFNTDSNYQITSIENVDYIVTDDSISSDDKLNFEQFNITIV